MQTAGARVLREDDQDLTGEAILLEWERKIEAAERRPSRFERSAAAAAADDLAGEPASAPGEADPNAQSARAPIAEAVQVEPRRFEQRVPARPQLVPQRRTITITGQPTPARRRSSLAERQLAQPDRIALWAFVLGLILVAVAAGTAHA